MAEKIQELGKEICEALICGDWRHIPVANLRHYENRADVVYRCHICHHQIVLMREGKDAAHFEHRPGNPDCLLSYDKLNPKIRRDPIFIIAVTNEEIEKSYDHVDLLKFTHRVSGPLSLLADIDDLNRSNIKQTVRKQLIDARCGQGQFRKSLISYWKRCAVSGAELIELLIASHIKPWSVCNSEERLDVFNGLLLSPNIDRAFDDGLITFNDDGMISISKKFKGYTVFGITEDQSIKVDQQHIPFLRYHRENVFVV